MQRLPVENFHILLFRVKETRDARMVNPRETLTLQHTLPLVAAATTAMRFDEPASNKAVSAVLHTFALLNRRAYPNLGACTASDAAWGSFPAVVRGEPTCLPGVCGMPWRFADSALLPSLPPSVAQSWWLRSFIRSNYEPNQPLARASILLPTSQQFSTFHCLRTIIQFRCSERMVLINESTTVR